MACSFGKEFCALLDALLDRFPPGPQLPAAALRSFRVELERRSWLCKHSQWKLQAAIHHVGQYMIRMESDKADPSDDWVLPERVVADIARQIDAVFASAPGANGADNTIPSQDGAASASAMDVTASGAQSLPVEPPQKRVRIAAPHECPVDGGAHSGLLRSQEWDDPLRELRARVRHSAEATEGCRRGPDR